MISSAILSFLEFLLMYQQSSYYIIHILLIIVCVGFLIWSFIYERSILKLEENPLPKTYCDKVNYLDYMKNVKRHTQQEVAKLENSEQFKQYLIDKANKRSKYYKE